MGFSHGNNEAVYRRPGPRSDSNHKELCFLDFSARRCRRRVSVIVTHACLHTTTLRLAATMNGGASEFGVLAAVVTAALAYKAHRSRAAAPAAPAAPAAADASASDSTPQPAPATVSVSAPGKVLVTGGYLVLRSLPGLTLSTTARFHSAATWTGGHGDAEERLATLLRQLPRSDAATADECVTVVVESPQMWTKWTYRLQCCHPFSLTSIDGKRNKFVERAMQCALQVFAHVGEKGRLETLLRAAAIAKLTLHLRLVADNDFYSQRDHVRVQPCA